MMNSFDLEMHRNKTLCVIKAVYKDLLQIDAEIFMHHSMVAGGAIRDSMLGAPVKDIDIFISVKDSKVEHALIQSLVNHYIFSMKLLGSAASVTGDGVRAYELSGYDIPVQLIFDREAYWKYTYVQQFPCSLSKCWWRPKDNKVHLMAECRNSVRTKQITYSKDCTQEYKSRIQRKYPTYRHHQSLS